jgi:hypothetical protein
MTNQFSVLRHAPMRQLRLFLDRPNDLNQAATREGVRHEAALERWRVMSMAEFQPSDDSPGG